MTLARSTPTGGYVRPEKQTVEDQRRSATTVANAVAKPLDGARRTWTTLEYRPSPRLVMDGPGRLAHSYGSEGWGFESLRARPGQSPFRLSVRALLLTDLLTAGPSPAGIERAKMSAAAATCSRITCA